MDNLKVTSKRGKIALVSVLMIIIVVVLIMKFVYADCSSYPSALFCDDFTTDSSGSYAWAHTAEAPYYNVSEGNHSWDSINQRLLVLTGNDVGEQFSTSITPTNNGTFSFIFNPIIGYISHGAVNIRLMENSQDYYQLTINEQHSNNDVSILDKVVGGVNVDSFTGANMYNNNIEYQINISFSPDYTVANALGEELTLINDNSQIQVNYIEIEFYQQDGYIDDIVLVSEAISCIPDCGTNICGLDPVCNIMSCLPGCSGTDICNSDGSACDPAPTCIDNDNDGYGNPGGDSSCLYGIQTDCDDSNRFINPGVAEICDNGVNENCNPADDVCPQQGDVCCGEIITFEDSATYLRNIYVSTTGNDNNDGSIGNPYATLGMAMQSVLPGDIIYLAQGTYAGGQTFNYIQGTATNPIQIVGAGNDRTIITGGPNVITLNNARYVVIRNIVFDDGTYNGISISDGGSFSTPAEHIIIDNVSVYNAGHGGNNDGIKLSGVDNFFVLNSRIINNTGTTGSGIDCVGCHEGVIANNYFENGDYNFIQTKGASSNILIHRNIFKNSQFQALNMGGATGAQYFRPPISSTVNYEARNITATSNIFLEMQNSAVSFDCDGCTFANNIIYKPSHWVFRILQSTVSANGIDFIPSRNGQFVNNIIVFDDQVSSFVNIGVGTQPDTFRFANNLWFHDSNPSFNYGSINLPTTEINSIYGQDPQFINPLNENFHILSTSPASNFGESGWASSDFDGNCFDVFDIGAFEPEPSTVCDNQTNQTCIDIDGDGYGIGAGCLGTDCDEDDSTTHNCNPADTDNSGCVEIDELDNYVNLWFQGSPGVTIELVARAIDAGEGC